jgi:hypothetical protein
MGQREPQFLSDPMSDRKKRFSPTLHNIYKKQHVARPCVEKMQLIFIVPSNCHQSFCNFRVEIYLNEYDHAVYSMPTGFFIWGYMYPFTFIFGGAMYPSNSLHLGVQRKFYEVKLPLNIVVEP